jgi:hypothetical protein
MSGEKSKYESLRNQLQEGDLVLFRYKSIIGKAVQLTDRAYYDHIGIVFQWEGRLFIIDSNAGGTKPRFLSSCISKAKDFCVLKPAAWAPGQISDTLKLLMDRADKRIQYDFGMILQIAIYRLFKIKTDMDNPGRDTCSEFARRYIRLLRKPSCICFEEPNIPANFITPWDFVLYYSPSFTLIGDESPRDKYRQI